MVKWIRFEEGQEIYTVECPRCKKLLNNEEDDKVIIVDILSSVGSGKLYLSAIWGDYSHHMESVTVHQEEVVEMLCPYCRESLISDDMCPDCGATTTMFGVSEGFIKICNRKGCKMHLKFHLTGE
ncbi:hypothetical protein [[Eubacterium] cellulosolvens]